MDKRTLTALEGSIKKWERIAAGEESDHGIDNCPLCEEFLDEADPEHDGVGECYGCPVAIAAKATSCENTPYSAWAHESNTKEGGGYNPQPWKADTEKKRELAKAELTFLKTLLPLYV